MLDIVAIVMNDQGCSTTTIKDRKRSATLKRITTGTAKANTIPPAKHPEENVGPRRYPSAISRNGDADITFANQIDAYRCTHTKQEATTVDGSCFVETQEEEPRSPTRIHIFFKPASEDSVERLIVEMTTTIVVHSSHTKQC